MPRSSSEAEGEGGPPAPSLGGADWRSGETRTAPSPFSHSLFRFLSLSKGLVVCFVGYPLSLCV